MRKEQIMQRLLSGLVLLFASPVLAGTAVLSWHANTEADLAGYHAHYGTAPGSYTQEATIDKATTSTTIAIPPSPQDQRWYFALDAYDTSGNRSPLSQEVNKLILAQADTRRTLYTWTFDTANENPLSLNGTWQGSYPTRSTLQIANNAVQASNAGQEGMETFSTPLPADQWMQCTLKQLGTDGWNGAVLYLNAAPPGPRNHYAFHIFPNSEPLNAEIGKGTNDQLGPIAGGQVKTTWANGDVVRAEHQGSTLRFLKNGQPLVSVTDTTYASSGRVGLAIYADRAVGSVILDDCSAGDWGPITPSPPPPPPDPTPGPAPNPGPDPSLPTVEQRLSLVESKLAAMRSAVCALTTKSTVRDALRKALGGC
jgi:hypothetical protein